MEEPPGWRAETSLRPTPPPRFAFIYPGGFNRAAIATGLFPQDAARGSREASGRWARGEPSAAPGERRLRLPGLCFRGRRLGGGVPALLPWGSAVGGPRRADAAGRPAAPQLGRPATVAALWQSTAHRGGAVHRGKQREIWRIVRNRKCPVCVCSAAPSPASRGRVGPGVPSPSSPVSVARY